LLLTQSAGAFGVREKIWEIQLAQIAVALGDENLAGNGVAHRGDSSSSPDGLRWE
jgi:hypothetical protein